MTDEETIPLAEMAAGFIFLLIAMYGIFFGSGPIIPVAAIFGIAIVTVARSFTREKYD